MRCEKYKELQDEALYVDFGYNSEEDMNQGLKER